MRYAQQTTVSAERSRGEIESILPEEAYREWEQACRQKWRALLLAVKAKLECVESGISSFEEEFMAHIVLPNGKTISEWMVPQIQTAYQSGKMPKLIPESVQ